MEHITSSESSESLNPAVGDSIYQIIIKMILLFNLFFITEWSWTDRLVCSKACFISSILANDDLRLIYRQWRRKNREKWKVSRYLVLDVFHWFILFRIYFFFSIEFDGILFIFSIILYNDDNEVVYDILLCIPMNSCWEAFIFLVPPDVGFHVVTRYSWKYRRGLFLYSSWSWRKGRSVHRLRVPSSHRIFGLWLYIVM